MLGRGADWPAQWEAVVGAPHPPDAQVPGPEGGGEEKDTRKREARGPQGPCGYFPASQGHPTWGPRQRGPAPLPRSPTWEDPKSPCRVTGGQKQCLSVSRAAGWEAGDQEGLWGQADEAAGTPGAENVPEGAR